MQKKVIILGGGVAGLSAAQELIERGFIVEVYEAKDTPGGKARSILISEKDSGYSNGQGSPLPGEHGFRFFPRFYKHVIDTMSRIPYGNRSVADNLVETSRVEMARYGQHSIILPSRSPRTMNDVREVLNDLPTVFGSNFGISSQEMAFFASRVWQIITSCEERRMQEYEKENWWDFIGAHTRSPAYQKLFGHGITRSLVAAKAHLASTKTIGNIFVQLLFDLIEPGPSSDLILNGPTNEVWINPWLKYLARLGVIYHPMTEAISIQTKNELIHSITVKQGDKSLDVQGDYYIAAVPIERMAQLVNSNVQDLDPRLGNLRQLSNNSLSWMSGIQFFLSEDVPITHGHTIYVDSSWALTSISQRQFWPNIDFRQYKDGSIKGIISVCISEWDEKGLNGKTAKECSREEIKIEVWEQLKRSINIGDSEILKDSFLRHWYLDSAIYLEKGKIATNEEPLLVNLINTWALRPEATTQIPNLFLASDYVRTYTDLATMEGANEAARRAVNAILDATGSEAARCQLWNLHEPEIFEPWRMIDRVRYQQGLPWDNSLVQWGLSALDLAYQGEELLQQFLTVGVDRPLEQLGNPIYAIGTQVFENTDLRIGMRDAVQRGIIDYLLRLAQMPGMPDVGRVPSIPATGSATATADSVDSATPAAKPASRTRSGQVRIIP